MSDKTLQLLESIKKRYNEINNLLIDTEVLKNRDQVTELSKEVSQIEDIVNVYNQYLAYIDELNENKTILFSEKNEEILLMVKLEIRNNQDKLDKLEKDLEELLLSKDPNDSKNVIIEIRGAAGGDEANIFAGNLYEMYFRYAQLQGWKVEILEKQESGVRRFTQISFIIKGKNVYSKMKFESGTHRVQRVPETESQGRIHTSTATVAILPEVSDVEVVIKNSDLKIDTYRSSGAGGQHVNTTDSAVRITHLPTGIVTTSQDGRSQHDNRDKALKVLRSKVYEFELAKQQEELLTIRKSAVGMGQRSEKVRTYNYPQNRVTDHRIEKSWQKLDQIMQGNLEDVINDLVNFEKQQKLEQQ